MRGREGQRDAEDPVVSFMTVTLHQILTQLAQRGLGIYGIYHACGKEDCNTSLFRKSEQEVIGVWSLPFISWACLRT